MRLLLDTHILLWAGRWVPGSRLSGDALALIVDPANEIHFSPLSIWEVATKYHSPRRTLAVDPHEWRLALRDRGYLEAPITAAHAAATADLPPIHRDPFDRMLLAQAMVEGLTLLTADATLARYPGPIRRV